MSNQTKGLNMEKASKWNKDELISLYKLKKEGKSFKEISAILNKSQQSAERKYARTDWDDFTEDPEAYLNGSGCRKWTQAEMHQLFAYLNAKQSYSFISDKLNRSPISVERKAQTTDWGAWETAVGCKENIEEIKNDDLEKQLVDALMSLSRNDPSRLASMTNEEFSRKINFESDKFPTKFSEIKKKAELQFEKIGLANPETLQLGAGRYVIVGDSHGKFTKTKTLDLLRNVNAHLKPNKIIHVGHILDDDNDISYEWGGYKNLLILAKSEELSLVQQQRKKYDFAYDIVRGCVTLGTDLVVINQDLISDYAKTPIASMDQEIIDEKVIVNCHRLEFVSKCSDGNSSYYASPGCLCERHIIRTIRQIDFEDNKTVKVAFHDGFTKYRRMGQLNKLWKQGLIVVDVDADGNHTITPCIIRKIQGEYVTSYFDKIITSSGVKEPNKKIFVHGDMHSPNHDNNVLDIQNSICSDYKPDVFVNIGDAHDFKSLNHHDMEKHRVVFSDLLDESARVHHILKKMSAWAPETHMIIGNHERFAEDFIAQYPQFESYLDFKFLCSLGDMGYTLTNLKSVLRLDSTKFIHGDMKMFGQSGNKLEKASRTFGDNVFIGHIHSPGIRFGCYSIGCACKLDQGYNEPNASTWMHGFGLCNQYKGFSFPTTVAIVSNKCLINGKVYEPVNAKAWHVKKYTASIKYDTE